MKFVVVPDLRKNKLLVGLLTLFHLAISIFLVFSFFVEKEKWGLRSSEIYTKILGDEESFIDPMSLTTILSEIHIDLFIWPFLLIMILLTRLRLPSQERILLFAISSFSLLLINSITPILLHFFPSTIYSHLKSISYALLLMITFSLVIQNFLGFFRAPKNEE